MPLQLGPLVSPSRRWFRVSLRGLMVLVLVVGGGVGWKVAQVRATRQAVALIQAAGGAIRYDYQFATDPQRHKLLASNREPAAPRWLRAWVGDDLFQEVAQVSLPDEVKSEVLAAVARLPRLVSLRMRRSDLGDGWGAQAGMARLEQVHLDGPGVTDPALRALGSLPALHEVRLGYAQVTAAGLLALAALPNLRVLELDRCRDVTDAGLGAALAASRSPALERLAWDRSDPTVTATVRALAAHHPGLSQLSFIRGAIADADLAPLIALTGLTDLMLAELRITAAGLAPAGRVRSLRSLSLNGVKVTAAGLDGLAGLTTLTHLELGGARVTDAGMRAVGRLRGLEDLVLTGSEVDDSGLDHLAGLPDLRDLGLGGTEITDAGAATLARFPALARLTLTQTRATDATLAVLVGLPTLVYLAVDFNGITPLGLTRFQAARPTTRVKIYPTLPLPSPRRPPPARQPRPAPAGSGQPAPSGRS